jgi:hypothetical protein
MENDEGNAKGIDGTLNAQLKRHKDTGKFIEKFDKQCS